MEALYLRDSYLKEFEAAVKSVKDGKFVVLDQTAFYPNSGGQPYDTGSMTRESDGKVFRVVFVGKFGGVISHEVENPEEGTTLKGGDRVKCSIDWERRYKLMRYHTASHVLSGIIHARTGALITGNQIGLDKTRIDFSLENYDPGMLQGFIREANDKAAAGAEVRISFITREEAERISTQASPGSGPSETLSKLAKGLPPDIKEIRVVDIMGIDRQADGGTHVRNTREIGTITFVKSENKGKDRRRVYFSLE